MSGLHIEPGTLSAYLTVMMLSFAVTAAATWWAIGFLRGLKAGQVIQHDGPQAHQAKSGTPTMGGVAILAGLVVPAVVGRSLIFSAPAGGGTKLLQGFYAVIFLVAAYALIGLADDWLTIRPVSGKRGIGSKPKFLLQFVAAALFVVWLGRSGNLDTVVRFGSWLRFDLGAAYAPLAVLFLTGMANFINITDGLDGLAAGLAAILAVSLAVMPGFLGTAQTYSGFSVLLLGLAGACAAFLWFNFNPAKIFMGDTGSLAIGTLIPAAAIVMKLEIAVIIAGIVFILDGLSSAVQWAFFKYTRIRTGTGRRVFKMSPVHHHFELSGWPEQLVVVRFWIAGVLFAAIALFLTAQSQMK
ncbi:MAG: phospho-N-acetylmuramoyl-pentapeptide-transferase [Armatimonadetes bacterium]|nr:phospho-N-acetylmuramoyl-pentapeptide-transferase [Armatimonadota bacterium]